MKTDKKEKFEIWKMTYPDGSKSTMTYDPVKWERDKIQKFKDKEKKIMEWHRLVVNGLVKGLSHTHRDGRLDDINFWRSRSQLFDNFAHCVLNLLTDQIYEYSEKNLKEIAEEGYKKEEMRFK